MFYIGLLDDDYRKEIKQALSERGLTSHMNDTKWRELCVAVFEEMPFVPPYEEKYVLKNEPQPFLGDWAVTPECMLGIHVEWIKVYPKKVTHRGHLIAPHIEDHSDQFRNILIRLGIPFTEDGDDFIIYGHSAGIELARHRSVAG